MASTILWYQLNGFETLPSQYHWLFNYNVGEWFLNQTIWKISHVNNKLICHTIRNQLFTYNIFTLTLFSRDKNSIKYILSKAPLEHYNMIVNKMKEIDKQSFSEELQMDENVWGFEKDEQFYLPNTLYELNNELNKLDPDIHDLLHLEYLHQWKQSHSRNKGRFQRIRKPRLLQRFSENCFTEDKFDSSKIILQNECNTILSSSPSSIISAYNVDIDFEDEDSDSDSDIKDSQR